MDRSSFVSDSLSPLVVLSYALKVSTGHMILLLWKQGKKNSLVGFPCLDCLARVAAKKVTPSGWYWRPFRSTCDRSAVLEGRVNDRRIVVFSVRCFDEICPLPPIEIMQSTTDCTLYVLLYLGKSGLLWKTPFINLVITGCFPTLNPSIFSCAC